MSKGFTGSSRILSLLLLAPFAAGAQQDYVPPATLAPSLSSPVEAESAEGGKRAWTIRPSLVLQETFTDNVVPAAETPRRDQVTEIAPGVRILGDTARVKLNLDYSVKELIYAQNSKERETQQSLNATGKLVAVDQFLFVDVTGAIRQQTISPFGPLSTGNYSVNGNSTETSNFRISPYVQGKLAGQVDYEGRYSRSQAHSKSSLVTDTDVEEWRALLRGDARARIGWQLELGMQAYDYNRGRTVETDRVRTQGSFRISPEWSVLATLGRERNDFYSSSKQSWQTSGYGFEWTPGPRTQISALREKRFFGHGHQVSVNHRFSRSAVKYSDSKDISALPSQLTTPGYGTLYDLWFAQLASLIPDEAARADYLAGYFQQNGLSLDSPISGFLGSQVSTQRRQELSYVLQGARNSLSVAVQRSQNDRLGTSGLGDGDLAAVSSVVQRGVSLGLSHKLSSLTTLNVQGLHTRSTAASGSGLESSQKILSAGLTTHVGARTTAGVSARRTVTEAAARSYDENAVVGTLTVQF